MNTKKILILLSICSILFSCNSINIIGHWEDKQNWVNLDLLSDSTYTYHFHNFSEQFMDYSDDKWTKNKNKITINSNIQNDIIPLEISYDKLKNNDKQICISVVLKILKPHSYGDYDEQHYMCEPFTNNTLPLREQLTAESVFKTVETNSDPYSGHCGSYIIYSDTLINNISFEISRTFFTSTYFIEQHIKTNKKELNCLLGDSIIINININDDLFNYKVFSNEVLNFIKNKIIILKDVENKRTTKLHKHKE